jgi:integrase
VRLVRRLCPSHAARLGDLQAAGPSPAKPYVFQSRKGPNRPISRRQALRILREVYDADELTGPLGTHAMRKTFANQVYRLSVNGWPPARPSIRSA